MKKIFALLAVVVSIFILLPLLGNQFMQEQIDERVKDLESKGLYVADEQSVSSYFTTSKHYSFVLKDAEAFVSLLNQYADRQIPPYVNAALEGAMMGVDLSYGNFPFTKALSVEIYPISLSQTMQEGLKRESLSLYEQIEKALAKKALLYHIDYELGSQNFSGYIRDISERFTLEASSEVSLALSGASFEGHGRLLAPDALRNSIDKLSFVMQNDAQQLKLDIEKFKSSNNYDSKNTYVSSAECQKVALITSGLDKNIHILAQSLQANASSNTQGEYAQLSSKTSLKTLAINLQETDLKIEEFNLDIGVDKLDKLSFLEASKLLSKLSKMDDVVAMQAFEKSLHSLFSKGFEINIADFSLSDVLLRKSEHLGGMKLKSHITLKEDPDFKQKLQISPLLLTQNVDIHTKLRISELMFFKLNASKPLPAQMQEYIKQDGSDYVFDMDYFAGAVTINDKAVR